MKKIGILIPYFGKFPEWADLFFETLKNNKTIDFIFFTDCEIKNYNAPNIFFNRVTFQEYIQLVNKKLPINFAPSRAYKLCDLRPLFGIVHKDILKNYDFYGWTDMDILFGDIRSFYTDDLLNSFDVLSTHAIRVSGHLAIFRNTNKNRTIYKHIYRWKDELQNDRFVGIDEGGLTRAYLETIFDKINQKYKLKLNNSITQFFSRLRRKKLYLKEQYTTPFTQIPWLDGTIDSQQPDTWYYKNGRITNNRDKNRSFIYLHLMNFKSSLWRHDGTKAPWEGKPKICFVAAEDMQTGIEISKEGIHKSPLAIQ